MRFHFLPIIHAAEKWANLEGGAEGVKDVATIGSLITLFQNAVKGITAFSGVVLFVVIVMSGFTFLFSGGDAKQLEKAKNSFTYALIGLIVIVCAYLILQLIELFTGTKVTMFDLNIEN